MAVEPGSKAPDFTAVDMSGSEFRLSEALKGVRGLVLYFYPRAMTPGCTREAVRFNELLDEFRSIGFEVVGVSTDPPERLRRFAEKHGLRFKLVSDPEGSIARLYGVLKKGTKRPSAERVTFIIDSAGTVRTVLKGIRPAERHADEALKEARRLAEEAGG